MRTGGSGAMGDEGEAKTHGVLFGDGCADGEPNSRVNKFLPGRTTGAEWGASAGLHPGSPSREGGA